MFQAMYSSIGDEVAEIMFKVQPMAKDSQEPKSVFGSLPQQMVHNEFSGLNRAAAQAAAEGRPPVEEEKPSPIHNDGPKVGRNDLCPCGSGKKYKKCHGQ